MKISTTDIYNDFVTINSQNKLALSRDIEHFQNTKSYFLGKLQPHIHYIENFTNIDYNSLDNLDKCISDKVVKSFVSSVSLSIEGLKLTVNGIVQINRNLNKSKEALQIIEKSDLDKDLFKEIIYRFNTKVSDEIILKGYIFRPGFGIGNTRIKKVACDTRIKKRINWGESNKNKKEILLRGGIPFAVTKRDDFGKAIEDNNGEKWFVYFDTPFDYLWHWGKKTANALNIPYYKFRPTKYNNSSKGGKLGNANKLKQLVTSNSPLLDNFFINEYI